jgi:hypothetical protein
MKSFLTCLIACGFCATAAHAAEPRTGEQIYKQLCANCHGPNGEGTEEHYPQGLVGDQSIGQLASLITRTMPLKAPEKCVGEDARAVAEYIHHAFYSPTAQARNKPARIELSRLTVRQYQNSVADLIGSFRPTIQRDAQQGLKGEYFKSRRQRKEDRLIERVDRQVQFDFGEGAPGNEGFEAEEFSVRWQGAVLAPETGDYEFILRTENGVRLWVNDQRQPLIDAGVKSGAGVIELRESIRLLGGRVYPLRLELFKSKQAKEKRASVALLWKPPYLVDEPIPARLLSPQWFPESFVVTTHFPPDDRSIGYERGTSISKAWDQATTDAAFETAAYVADHLPELAGVKNDAGDRAEKLKQFAGKFVERAFRRPLSDDERQLYIEHQFAEAGDPDLAIKRVVLLTLKSPRFLYREISRGSADDHTIASRLSFALWDSLPDPPLLQAAAKGELHSREQVQRQAERMATDPRVHSKLREFLLQWLKVDQPPDLSKSTERFPEFNAAMAADLRTSLDLFLDDVVWSPDSDFRQLILSDDVYLNGRLAEYYAPDLPADATNPGNVEFRKVTLNPEVRAGVLSHPYLMAGFAYTATSSPIHRGVFISRSVLGRFLKPPPEAVAPLPPDLHANLTTRERVLLQTKPEACQSCHNLINPLGFTLEQFDADGRYRTSEHGKPVDPTGDYVTRSGETVKFTGVRDLATFLAASDETQEAFAEQLFHYLVKQPIRAYGEGTLDRLEADFARNQFHIRKLVVDIAVNAALTAGTQQTAAATTPPAR